MDVANFKPWTLDLRLYYEIHGAGEPLILIPGFASGAWNWFRQIEDLARSFQVVIFDPRGVSRSQISGDATFTLEEIVKDVADLLDNLKIERATVLGASFGGFVAQELALAFPQKVNKLILACTSFGGKNHVAPDLEVLMSFASLENLNQPTRIRKFMIPAFTPEFRTAHKAVVEQTCQLREQNVVPENVYLAQLQAAATFDAEPRIKGIKATTLVLTGDTDVVVPPQNSLNLAGAISNAKLETVANSGHMFFIEKADKFNQIVTKFITQS